MSPLLGDALLHAQSDERLARLSAEGRERAFATLVERHRAALLRHARHVIGDDEAEDVVQQALAQAWRSLLGGTQVGHVRGWLFQIVRHTCYKAAAERATTGRISPDMVGSAGADADSENRLAARDLVAHMAALPTNQRAALVQTVLEGQSRREVARSLGLTEGAVRQLVHRARSTLRAGASALIPLPLVQWAAGGTCLSSPSTERVGEMLAGVGAAAGLTGLAAKTGVAIVAAGAVAAGTVATQIHHAPHRASAPSSSAGGSASAGGASPAGAAASTTRLASSSARASSGPGRTGSAGSEDRGAGPHSGSGSGSGSGSRAGGTGGPGPSGRGPGGSTVPDDPGAASGRSPGGPGSSLAGSGSGSGAGSGSGSGSGSGGPDPGEGAGHGGSAAGPGDPPPVVAPETGDEHHGGSGEGTSG